MLPDIKRQLTHWVDGMKIHKQHFTDSENALLDQLRDSTALRLTNFNFGLLHPSPTEKRSIDVKIIRAQHANFKIVLSHCRAVTAGGCRIEILPGDDEVVCEDSVNINISVGVGSVK